MCCHRRRPEGPRQLTDAESEEAQRNWGRLVRRLQHLRKMQRRWAYVGHFLQSFPASLRRRLRREFPKA